MRKWLIKGGSIGVVIGLLLSAVFAAYLIFIRINQPERYAGVRGDAWRDLDVKKGLRVIYEALREYYRENGQYPIYIWGGSYQAWEDALTTGAYSEFEDPLLSTGVLTNYPKNPYFPEVREICVQTGMDPRFGCLTSLGKSRTAGGEYMGNILSDNRFRARTSPPKSVIENRPDLYYVYTGDTSFWTVDWLPGEFGYRALDRQHFILFAYGSRRNTGLDILNHEMGEKERQGGLLSPPNVAFLSSLKEGEPLRYGNPDGIPDGVILVFNQDGPLMEYSYPLE